MESPNTLPPSDQPHNPHDQPRDQPCGQSHNPPSASNPTSGPTSDRVSEADGDSGLQYRYDWGDRAHRAALEEAVPHPVVLNDWASFAPSLMAAFAAALGSFRYDCGEDAVDRYPYVLELGGGLYSTPLLAQVCEADGVSLITIESDQVWVPRIAAALDGLRLDNPNYDILVPRELAQLQGRSQYDRAWESAWSEVVNSSLGQYALRDEVCLLMLIDLAPHSARAAALRTALYHRNRPRIIVAHDTEGPLRYTAEHDRGYSRMAVTWPRSTTRLCYGRRPPATTTIDLRP